MATIKLESIKQVENLVRSVGMDTLKVLYKSHILSSDEKEMIRHAFNNRNSTTYTLKESNDPRKNLKTTQSSKELKLLSKDLVQKSGLKIDQNY